MSDNVITRFNYYCYSQVYKGRVQKKEKLWKIPLRGWGSVMADFPLWKKTWA